MSVPPPWSGDFEASWTVPQGALSGELLRGPPGEYVAAVTWASPDDCARWLERDRTGATETATTLFQACGHQEGAAAEAEAAAPAAAAAARAPMAAAWSSTAASVFERRQGLGEAAPPPSFESFRSPEVDPRTLFAIAAGEEVDIDEEDEVLVSGGDPSFLDDSKWEASTATSRGKEIIGGGRPDDMPSIDEVLFDGGDAAFLDDSLWEAAESKGGKVALAGNQPPAAKFEWDGEVDETAHFDG